MRRLAGLGSCFVFVAAFFGCAAAVDQPTASEEVKLSEAHLALGCHVSCPKCPPNKVCPLAPCTIECPPGVTMCGDNACSKNEYCCGSSCGICEPIGYMCPATCATTVPAAKHSCVETVLCMQGYVWSTKACTCVPMK